MKKVIALILVVVLSVGMLAACGASPSTDTSASSSSAASTDSAKATDTATGGQLIGVAMPTQSLQRWNQDGANMKKELEAKGYKVDLQYANNDVNTQIQQIENMIVKGSKVVVIASIDGSALSDVLKKAADSGVKVIAYDRLIMKTPNVDYYATFDNFKVGVIQGQYIETKLGLKDGKGPFNIELFGGSPDDNNANYFFDGAYSILKPYIDSGKLVVTSGQKDFAKIAIQGWDSAKAQARMDNLITANYAGGKKLDAVLSPNDSLAIGIVASLKNAGYGSSDKPYPIITGQDCDKPNVMAMINGQQSMSIFKDTRTLATKVVEMVDSVLQGKEASVNNKTDYNNGSKIVPSFLCDPVYADKENYKKILVDSGYYKEADLK
ncbi:periplasmic binding protein/LacI transcriptional regulator [Ruminiclostridium papyrosolvens DSM 2782]|uniref:Periplasmic binding protein/LacI transcriptional regulator n=1 Tax=Ruminiclostridium papyrosolvens DSM 2782 TaxID=588581 RepID=F1TAC7_9FIRM|nr:multiple monosaccharide ABC transporter substrate-binding protein [Ruminiclostridium papyrosolvens]EGD48470.1 periplasmic binding protein/LacI transcriptional regulator [Ruminiclostridium papyrosolvens DSM 2782]WES32771.1 sugar ABC transporter substrate-binding protein [Ruminiclostridium papyrosolvens DSM 2782]